MLRHTLVEGDFWETAHLATRGSKADVDLTFLRRLYESDGLRVEELCNPRVDYGWDVFHVSQSLES